MLLTALILGLAVGFGASWGLHDARRLQGIEEERQKGTEDREEIARLRAQVALHINEDTA